MAGLVAAIDMRDRLPEMGVLVLLPFLVIDLVAATTAGPSAPVTVTVPSILTQVYNDVAAAAKDGGKPSFSAPSARRSRRPSRSRPGCLRSRP